MNLNQEQIKYINLKKGCYLILAGAGSGKTLVITQRFLELVNVVKYQSILCVTFSNKAANEISERITKNGHEYNNLWIGTFHSIAFRLLIIYNKINEKTIIIDEYDKKKILIKLNLLDYLNTIYSKKTPKEVYHKYQDYCIENNLIDFDYILIKLYHCLSIDLNFRKEVSNRFEYIMVDEYQDTSIEQQDILELIVNNNIFCVGDVDQAIYTWRNASIDNILSFKNNFPNAEIFTLLNNYRCSGNIVALSNVIIKENKNRYNKEAVTTNEPGYKPILIHMHKKTLGEYIASDIIHDIGTKAILVRTSMMIKKVEEELLTHNIPYEITYNQGLIDKKEFKIILAYLKVLLNEDKLALELYFSQPRRNIGLKKIEAILELNMKLFDAMNVICPQEYERIQPWFELNTINAQWKFLLQLIGYDENNIVIQQIKLYIFKYLSMRDFLTNSMLNQFDDKSSHNHNKIYIMTIHAAKGLEFDNVIMPYMVEGCMPCRTAIQFNNIEEERRLMYVAVTRAKSKLYLMYNLSDSPQVNFFGISRFLARIPSYMFRSLSI